MHRQAKVRGHIETTMRDEDSKKQKSLEEQTMVEQKSKERTDVIDQLEEVGQFKNGSASGSCSPSSTQQDVSPGKLFKTSSTKDYVAATLNAWSNCPGIVKRQLDK